MAPSYGVNEARQDLGTPAIPALDAAVRAIPDDSPILGPIDREKGRPDGVAVGAPLPSRP
jgi:hypothetical protein